ncbi:MAG: DNA gyrase C-terminal beta-propeller domain-containing protein, partial [Chloroflexota bacterium]
FGVQTLALIDREPRLLSLKRALQVYIDHREEVIRRRTQFELDKALRRQHILEGLLIALDHLDEVIDTIRNAEDVEDARGKLVGRFGLTEEQANAILDMQLRRLAALERQKIQDEYAEITAEVARLRGILADRNKILTIIKDDLAYLKEKYGDERRTEIAPHLDPDLDMEDLIQDEDVLISITQRGYIKRTPVDAYRRQGRGGKGLIGMGTRDEDELEHLFAAGTLNSLLFFSDKGKVYSERAYQIPEYDRTAKGTSLMNVLPLMPDENITAALAVNDFDEGEYLTMVTRKGRIKRVEIGAFRNVRPSGLIAINLDNNDELRWVKVTDGGQDLILVSEQGRAIRFAEEDVRSMSRTAAGVYAMRLDDGDFITGVDVVEPDGDLLLITELGFGKRTALNEFRRQGRYGKGVRAMTVGALTGRIVGARVVTAEDEVTCISSTGIILRTSVSNVSRQGRYSRGVTVMDLRDGDTIASVAVLREGRLSRANGDGEEDGAVKDEDITASREEAVEPTQMGNGQSPQPSKDGEQ